MSWRVADVPNANYYRRSSSSIGAVWIERAANFDAIFIKVSLAVVHKGEYSLILDVPGICKEVVDNILDVLDNTVLLPKALGQSTFFSIVRKYHSKAFFHSSPLIKACCKASYAALECSISDCYNRCILS